MKRVLIISTSLEEQSKIEEVAKFHNPGGLTIETTGSFAQDITYWTTQAPDVLILQIPDDDLLQGYFFTKLRKDVHAKQALILLCSAISQKLMQLSMHFSKVRMLKAPVDGFSLYRAVMDLSQDFQVTEGKAIHPRYLTDLPIEIVLEKTNSKRQAMMKNLSLSGAYFESSDPLVNLVPGDFCQLNIQIASKKQYTIDVKVVWSKPQKSGAQGYGVTFVNKEEVYNNLLKNL